MSSELPRLQPPPVPPSAAPREHWSSRHLVFFRWTFCYFLLYTLPSRGRVTLLPMEGLFERISQPITIWIATHIFHVTGHAATYFATGSGDTTLNYVENFCYLVIASIATVVWSLLDRRRTNYARLRGWFRIWLRYTLAYTMFAYGFAKVFVLQMQMSLPVMVQQWGDFSPMGALWNFMGASRPYTILSGAAEVAGGLLLLSRRTTLLGAMISLGVLFNVAALNYCYDVPVKLYSTNLLLMSLFLIGPDLRRLTQLFLLNTPIPPADLSRPRLSHVWMVIVLWVFKCGAIYWMALNSWGGYQQVYGETNMQPLHGLYEVEGFIRNGKESPPLLGDTEQWRWLYFSKSGGITVIPMNRQSKYFGSHQEATNSTVTFSSDTATNVFIYSWTATNHAVLRGSMGTNDLEVRARAVPPSDFLLLNRGFHWINEYPFSR